MFDTVPLLTALVLRLEADTTALKPSNLSLQQKLDDQRSSANDRISAMEAKLQALELSANQNEQIAALQECR